MVGELGTSDDEDAANEWDVGEHIDQVTGRELEPKLWRKARLEEIAFMNMIRLYEEVDAQECWGKTGKAPISTKWVGPEQRGAGSA